MAENLGSIQLVAALRPGPLGPRRLARAVGRQRPMVLTILTDRSVVGAIEDRCTRLESIRHPALGRVRAVIRYQGGLAMVEDTVDGVPLSVILEQGALPQSAAVGLVRRVFRALHICWNRTESTPPHPGLIHGDLNPEQIWVEPGSKVKVLGLGTVLGEPRCDDPYRHEEAGRSPYCAPECLKDAEFHTSDVYSAAAILGALITGRAPGHSSIDPDWHASVIQSMEHRLNQKGCHPELQDLITNCLSLQPTDRPTAMEMGQALETLQSRLSGSKKEEWCADVIPGLIRYSRGEDQPGGTDATPSFQTSTDSTRQPESDPESPAEDSTDPRLPRPPPLVSPQDAPGYGDIQVDPHTGEVTWGAALGEPDAASKDFDSNAIGEHRLEEQPTEEMRSPMELIPPSWVLEDEDDETDEVERASEADTDKVVEFDEEDSLEIPVPSILGPEMERELFSPPPVLENEPVEDELDPTTDLAEWAPHLSSPKFQSAESESNLEWQPRTKSSPWGPWAWVALLLVGILTFMWSDDAPPTATASKVSATPPDVVSPHAGAKTISNGHSSMTVPADPSGHQSAPLVAPPSPMARSAELDNVEPDSPTRLSDDDNLSAEPPVLALSQPSPSPAVVAERPVDVHQETSPKPQANQTDVSPAVQQGEGNDDSAEAQSSMARLRIDMDSETGLRVVDSGLGHLVNGQEIELAEGPVVLEAFFRGGTELGIQYQVQLTNDETVTLRCRADFQRCTCSPRNACSVR